MLLTFLVSLNSFHLPAPLVFVFITISNRSHIFGLNESSTEGFKVEKTIYFWCIITMVTWYASCLATGERKTEKKSESQGGIEPTTSVTLVSQVVYLGCYTAVSHWFAGVIQRDHGNLPEGRSLDSICIWENNVHRLLWESEGRMNCKATKRVPKWTVQQEGENGAAAWFGINNK